MTAVLRSLPFTLAARLLPVLVLAVLGSTMTSGTHSDAHTKTAAPDPGPSGSSSSGSPTTTTSVAYAKPPEPCTSVPPSVVKNLVPGAKTAGVALKTTDARRRTGCSWNALKGYDYRWLDVSFEVSATIAEADTAFTQQVKQTGAGPASGVGDEVQAIGTLTTDSGQQTRQAVVIARKGNAVVTVTYNGSNFETKKAPADAVIRKGAFKAATSAVAALGTGGTAGSAGSTAAAGTGSSLAGS
jgi:hypothetical protein